MKRILIFNDYIGGHQLEYVHHLYMDAIKKLDNEYFFAVPFKRFKEDSSKFVWIKSKNIKIIFLEEKDLHFENSNILMKSFYKSKLLHKTIKETNATHVFLIELIGFLPFLPFFIRKKTSLSGILYKIYLYRRKDSNLFLIFQDILKELLLVNFRVFEKVFILNDNGAKQYLNRHYKTSKFHFLPDPVVKIDQSSLTDLRSQLKIDPSKIILLHPGGQELRKGTIEIFKAIEKMNSDNRNKFTFIFAGRVVNEIADDYFTFYNKLKNSTQIVVINEFCSYEFLGSLYYTCDAILIPYKETAQSSGTIGFAAQFKKPVIAPNIDLIGKIVKRNNLGILLDSSDSDSIARCLESKISWEYKENDYLVKNSVSSFLAELDI